MAYSMFRANKDDDDLPNRMPQLSKSTYYAVQRALKNIWFGEASPIQEAVNYICMEEGETSAESVKIELARLVNLILQKIVIAQQDESVMQVISWEQARIRKTLLQGSPKLAQLWQEERILHKEIATKEERVRELRKRQRYLDNQEVLLRKKITKLEENQKYVESELERVMHLNPIETNKMLLTIQHLTKSEIEER